ncbi:hypothetical protein AB0C34_05500 [Nocardia sp. NPDC049220]|uniref:hypothetical protein n=1 Tax=Nocardia sp. NPDC049220 TaxID=3155273 RepID=UPI0033C42921
MITRSTRSRVAAAGTAVLTRTAEGGFDVLVEAVLPLNQPSGAHRLLENRVTPGTIVLRPKPSRR